MFEKKLECGLVHIYTGDGKGKTSAAVGQGMRTAGRGYKVLMVQFLKGEETGELYSIKKLFPCFTYMRAGEIKGFYQNLSKEDQKNVQKDIFEGMEKVRQALSSEEYNLIILDEIMILLKYNIVQLDNIMELIKNRPQCVEIILTGRNAPEELIRLADYVTEMKMIKHPYEKGILAREGIEY